MMSHRRVVHLLVVQSLLAGCAAGTGLSGVRAGSFMMGDAWLNLSEPRGVDWSTQQLQAPGLGERRQAFVDSLAGSQRAVATMPGFSLQGTWPNVGGNNWGTTPKGRLITDLVGGANEICNGMAAGMYWDAASTRRFVYMLSQNGRFIRVPSDSTDLATDAVAIDLYDPSVPSATFNNTSIVMSPACSRAYVLSDAARLYVINLAGSMSVVNPGGTQVGTGSPTANYLAPMLDPAQSQHNDTRDVLYVPRNDGNVYRVVFEPSMNAPVETGGPYAVATAATPKTGGGCTGCSDFSSYNLAAHGIAFKGRIFIGDTEGVFHDYDTNPGTPTNTTYPLGTVAGIAAPPALDLQTGANPVTRPDGSTYTVQDLEPNHAFVNVTRGAGPVCAWIDLGQKTVTFSRPLFLDDNDTANDEELYGEMASYAHNLTSSGTAEITVSDAVSVADTAGGTLSGANAYVATPLSPSTGGIPGGTGGSDVFFRFDTSGLDAAVRIKEARLQVVHDPAASTTITPPLAARVGGYDANGSTGWYPRSGGGVNSAWTSASTNPLGPGTSPVLYNRAPARALDLYTGGTFTFGLNGVYNWRVTDLLVGPVRTTYNAFALTYDGGTATWGSGSTDAPRFEPVGSTGQPKLFIDWEKPANIPSFPVETAPILDATRKRVYVYVSNFLFALKYDEPARWSDTYHDASFNFAPNTTYQASFLGRTTGARDQNDTNVFIRNKTTPAVAFDMSAIYVLSRGKGSSTHELAVSKITPATGGTLPGANPFGPSVGDVAVDNDASKAISTTVNNSLTSGTTEVANPDGSRFMLIDPYSNIFGSGYALGKGGDLYFGIKDPRQIYRIGTDN